MVIVIIYLYLYCYRHRSGHSPHHQHHHHHHIHPCPRACPPSHPHPHSGTVAALIRLVYCCVHVIIGTFPWMKIYFPVVFAVKGLSENFRNKQASNFRTVILADWNNSSHVSVQFSHCFL